jgi:glycosyltransferase involved in cell wall biosynthesis
MRIAFLTRSLEVGGAERQLVLLAKGLADRGHQVLLLSMYPGGALASQLAGSQVVLKDLRKRSRWDLVGFLGSLRRELNNWRTEVIHSYLDVPNLLSALTRPFAGRVPVVWGIRDALADLSAYDSFSRFCRGLTYPVSRLAQGVIANSSAAKELHLAKGLSSKNLAVIPNGIEVERFRFDLVGRKRLRARWGIQPEEPLIGLTARLDPKKDHPSFMEAAQSVLAERPGTRFVCIGSGPLHLSEQYQRAAQDMGLSPALVWTGEVADMAAAYSACDIAISASYGESFPNAVAEAMACERPVVVTAAGDTAELVGPLGLVTPVRNPMALAAGCLHLLDLSPDDLQEMGRRLRTRVEKRYSVEAMVKATEVYLQRLIQGRIN